jgi:hypothetical protein
VPAPPPARPAAAPAPAPEKKKQGGAKDEEIFFDIDLGG